MNLFDLRFKLCELSSIISMYYDVAPWTSGNRIILLYKNDDCTKDTSRGNIIIYIDDENNITFELGDLTYNVLDIVLSRKYQAIAQLIDIAGQGRTNKRRFIDIITEFANCHNI